MHTIAVAIVPYTHALLSLGVLSEDNILAVAPDVLIAPELTNFRRCFGKVVTIVARTPAELTRLRAHLPFTSFTFPLIAQE